MATQLRTTHRFMFRYTLARARALAISIIAMSSLALLIGLRSEVPQSPQVLFWLVLAGFALQVAAAVAWLRQLRSAPAPDEHETDHTATRP